MNSKQITYLNIRPEIINYIEENIGTKLLDLGRYQKEFYDPNPKGKGRKGKDKVMELYQIKKRLHSKETATKTERQ